MGLSEEGRANINKAFTRALFKCPETSQPSDTLLNKATVDVHGVILSHRWWPVWLLYIGNVYKKTCLGLPEDVYSHIGVGSSVVRS